MNTTPLLGGLALVVLAPASALGQDLGMAVGMHPIMFMWGTGSS